MAVRGIRGATTVDRDEPDTLLAATEELLRAITVANGLTPEDIGSVIFTVTPDLASEYPARAARRLGWDAVPLLGATEMDVPGGLPRCVRVLVHVNTARSAAEIEHVYLRDAVALRRDR